MGFPESAPLGPDGAPLEGFEEEGDEFELERGGEWAPGGGLSRTSQKLSRNCVVVAFFETPYERSCADLTK